ncbi:MAG TPA: tail fiber domain-containing protein [Clostridiales bacterium]|nr:tail fiber domain-containing protein [Clostridiales bacterium]
MLNVSPELKTLYKTVKTPKCYSIYFPSLELSVNEPGKNNKMVSKSFELKERLCSDDGLKYGECVASQIKFTLADVAADIKNHEFVIDQKISGFDVHFGIYKVESVEKQNNLRFKDIVAYDRMKNIEVDAAEWYNGLTFPLTLSEFRASFLSFVGLEQDISKLPLPNDGMTVEKTISVSQLAGRAVIEACEEVNGCFGHIDREGKFTHIILAPGYGDYPTDDYPTDDYPVSEADTSYTMPTDETITAGMRESIKFEEYTVKEITKLIIRQDDDDIGAIVGEGSNSYIIQDNFLVYGKSAAELETIATNIFGYIAKRPYRPYESSNIGLPYVEIGDMLEFEQNDPVKGYVFGRTLTGIHGLRDIFTAAGPEEQTQNFGLNYEIQQIKGRTARIVKTVDEVSVSLSDLEENVDTSFNIMHGEIQLKVDKAGVIAAINVSPENIKIAARNIQLEGIVTANNYFKILPDGSMEAVNGKFSGQLVAATGTFSGNLSAAGGTFSGAIIGGSISIGGRFSVNSNGYLTASGATFTDGKITSNGPSGRLEMDGAYINGYNSSGGLILFIGASGTVSAVALYAPDGYLTRVNGGTPITSLNYDNNTYVFPPKTHTHTSLYDGVAKVTAYGPNFRPHSDSGDNSISCGSPSYRWTQVFAATPVISTSDATLKQQGRSLSDAERRVAQKIKANIKLFKFNDAVEAKGDDARWHTGVYAQEVKGYFEEEGLDPYHYALFCSDTWYEKDGNAVDENEKPYTIEEEGVIEVTQLGLRYAELWGFVIASL